MGSQSKQCIVGSIDENEATWASAGARFPMKESIHWMALVGILERVWFAMWDGKSACAAASEASDTGLRRAGATSAAATSLL